MQIRLILCTLAVLLLASCGGGGSVPDGNRDPDNGDPVVTEPNLADPSEVQNPRAILPTAAVLWPAQGGGPGNSSRTGMKLPDDQPAIASITSVSDLTSSSARIGPDGNILVGAGSLLQKFSPDGYLLWQRSLLRQLNGRPSIDSSGQCVIASGDPSWMDSAQRGNWVEAIDPAGQTRWRWDSGDYAAVVYGMRDDGSVLVRSAQDRFSMLSSAGGVLWQAQLNAFALYGVAFDGAGRVYGGSDTTALFCLDADGEQLWQYNPADVDPTTLTTNSRMLHPDGSIVLLTGREGDAQSFHVSIVGNDGQLIDEWPCLEVFSLSGASEAGEIMLLDRESGLHSYSLSGELLSSFSPGYGLPFGVNVNSTPRYYSVQAQPDDFSEYLLAAIDSNGSELWRLSSMWSFRFPVDGANGLLYCGDEQSFFALDSLGRRHWQQIHGDRLNGLSVSSNGRIYSSGGRNLYAFDGNGRQLWQISADGEIHSTPALLPGGQLAFGDSEGFFYFYEDNGTRISKYILDGSVASSPAVAADGSLYVGTTTGELYSFGADLSPLRQFHADSGIRSTPAIDGDGTVFVATEDGHVHAVFSDGVEAWEYNLGEPLAGQLVLGDGFRLFGATANGRVFAIHAYDGSLLWDHFIGQDIAGGLALHSDGSLLVATDNGAGRREVPQLEKDGSGRGLYCLSPEGSVQWSLNGPYSFSSQPLVDASGPICFEAGGWLVCVDSTGKELWRLQAGFEDDVTAAAPLSDGRLAVCSGTQLLIVE
ncbi:MAG: PQQ-binding-like beta-propeller repeat protein [Planctomycetales bacterium]|nr:PQQ-binding-like beta-propeller repeat protein [bacterium]UNM09243.1 MAG: PQQ-binding-like beta-propeller repeat protein [Planctomycetales bacterium]